MLIKFSKIQICMSYLSHDTTSKLMKPTKSPWSQVSQNLKLVIFISYLFMTLRQPGHPYDIHLRIGVGVGVGNDKEKNTKKTFLPVLVLPTPTPTPTPTIIMIGVGVGSGIDICLQ